MTARVECEHGSLKRKCEVCALQVEVTLLTRKVITCGVAASHPDPDLSRNPQHYGGPWDSPQAEEVRKLRADRDKAKAQLALAGRAIEAARGLAESVWPDTEEWYAPADEVQRLRKWQAELRQWDESNTKS